MWLSGRALASMHEAWVPSPILRARVGTELVVRVSDSRGGQGREGKLPPGLLSGASRLQSSGCCARGLASGSAKTSCFLGWRTSGGQRMLPDPRIHVTVKHGNTGGKMENTKRKK